MLTDVELMLLEHLEYINSDVEYVAGVTVGDWAGRTVGEILSVFDEEALLWLAAKGEEIIGELVSGLEWSALISAIAENEHLSKLYCLGRDPSVFAACYRDPEGNAFVTFRGTSSGHEWYDDVDGLHGSDTVCQEDALAYIENLPFDKITVVGHSKGGNKAQYLAVVSDKVIHCVSMDGQGFSREFIDKYKDRILANAGHIRNYSLSTDYVHILLYPVPGSRQIYCKGGPLHVGYRAHSPAGFFRYENAEAKEKKITFDDFEIPDILTSDGKAPLEKDGGERELQKPVLDRMIERRKLSLNEEGLPYLQVTEENAGMRYLHGFTCFALATMRENMKERMIAYLGNVLALSMSEDFEVEAEGEVYTQKTLISYIFSDQRTAAFFLAYIFKYVDTYNLSEDDFIALLAGFGVKGFYEEFRGEADKKRKFAMYRQSHSLLAFLLKQLKDGRVDPILEDILEMVIKKWMKKSSLEDELSGIVDVRKIWRDTERAFLKIKVHDPGQAAEDAEIADTGDAS